MNDETTPGRAGVPPWTILLLAIAASGHYKAGMRGTIALAG